MFNVADVLRPEVGRSWHEAVAIVQEVASLVGAGSVVPDPADLMIDEDGTMHLGFGSDGAQNPVSALGVLLRGLLEGIDAPAGLRELATENASAAPAHATVESFQRALAFYERPSRANDLQAVASRLRAAVRTATPEQEFERLREQVAAKAEARPTPGPAESKRRISRRTIAIAAVVELAVLAAIVGYARPQYFRGAGSLGDRVEQRVSETIASGLNRLSGGDVAEAAPSEAEVPGMPGSDLSDGSRPVGTSQTDKGRPRTPIVTPRGGQARAARTGTGPSGAERASLADADAAAPFADDLGGGVTYSSTDAEVEPPRLNRPQLPREPEPGKDTGYFDVIVSETGDVEQVRLISPAKRFQERMLIAAAKAWKFRPAMRDGQPVRYRLRIAIILPAQP